MVRTSLLVGLLSVAAAMPAAEPGLIGFAPADSGVLVGINVRQIRESDFGKKLAELLTQTPNEGLHAFTEQSGLDPLRDLEEVLVAAPARPNPNPLVIVRGHFDVKKLSQMAAAGGMLAAEYHGVQVMARAGQKGGFSALAVVDASLVVAGDEAGVRAAVDRRGRGTGVSAAMAAKAGEFAKANAIWMLMRVAPSSLVAQGENPGAAGKLIETIEQASLGVRFATEVTLWAQAVTRTPQDAEHMVGAAQFFSAMSAANHTGHPEMAALLERVKVEAEGNTAKLSMLIPEAEAEAALQAAMAKTETKEPEPEPEPSPAPSETPSQDPNADTPNP